MTRNSSANPDVLVLGGGLVGSAVAWGLAREGAQVTVLDQDDGAFRASRGGSRCMPAAACKRAE